MHSSKLGKQLIRANVQLLSQIDAIVVELLVSALTLCMSCL